MIRILAAGLLTVALPLAAHATAMLEAVNGDVQAGGVPVFQGQRVNPPATFTTGAGSQALLRFEDGMQIMLNENSLLRMVDFRYASGAADRAVFELLRGAARVVTGAVAQSNPKQFAFRTPQTELRVERGADFSVALVNPAYVAVHSGSVISANAWGTVTLNAGSTSVVASSAAAPAAVSAASMPPAASSAMANLSGASLTAGGTAVGAGGAAATGGAGFFLPTVIFAGAVAGVAAAVANEDNNEPQSTATHH